MLRPIAISCAFLLGSLSLHAQSGVYIDLSQPWNPATTVPQFITANPVDLAQLSAFSLFRSGEGHDFTDDYEASGRSMKNYLNVQAGLIGTFNTVAVYSPVNGTIAGVDAEQSEIAPGVPRGYQIHLNPTGFAAFDVRLFHINLDAALGVGDTVTAGQFLGFAELRPSSPNFDWAVMAAWSAAPDALKLAARPVEFQGFPYNTLGARLLNPFELMDTSTFAAWGTYGITDLSETFFTKEYRDAHPSAFSGPSNPADYFTLAAVPEPATYAGFAGALAFLGAWTLRRRTRS